MEGTLGLILLFTASYQIIFLFRSPEGRRERPEKPQVLPFLLLPLGAEVVFSLGALGSAALLSLTKLTPAQVVGADVAFGFLISLIDSGAHWFTHSMNPELLLPLTQTAS